MVRIESGLPTSRNTVPARGGFAAAPSLTYEDAKSRAGRTLISCAANSSATPLRRPTGRGHPGNDRARGPKWVMHVLSFRTPTTSNSPARIDESRCPHRRERTHRIRLVHHATRSPRLTDLESTSLSGQCDLRMNRRLAQPPRTVFAPSSTATTPIRNATHRR